MGVCNFDNDMKKTELKFDYSKISGVKVEGIDYNDYPDFCDAFISEADYDGEPMNDKQIEELNEDYDFVYDEIIKHIF